MSAVPPIALLFEEAGRTMLTFWQLLCPVHRAAYLEAVQLQSMQCFAKAIVAQREGHVQLPYRFSAQVPHV